MTNEEQPETASELQKDFQNLPIGERLKHGPDRGRDGRFLKDNGASFKTGAYSERVERGEMPGQEETARRLSETVAAILADLGGPDATSVVVMGMVERHARLEMVSVYLFERLREKGPLTAKGAQRAALTAWLQVVDRLNRSAQALGLDRRRAPIVDTSDLSRLSNDELLDELNRLTQQFAQLAQTEREVAG